MTATDPASELGGALAGAEQVVLIWNGRVSQAAADILAHLAHSLDARVLITPAGNELGAHAAGLGTHSPSEVLEAVESGQIKAIVLLGADPVGDWTNGERWRGALARAQFVLQVTAFQNDSSGWATTIVPASESLEQEGTVTNLEGRVQRLRAAATPPPGVPDGYDWTAELGERLGLEVPSDAAQAFIELAQSRTAFAGMSWSSLGERAELPERPQASSTPAEPRLAGDAGAPQGTMLVAYRELISGTAADRSPELHFQKRVGIEINHDDAEAMGVATGDRITVSYDSRTAPARQSPPGGCGPAPCDWPSECPTWGPRRWPPTPPRSRPMPDGFWITLVKAVVLANLVMAVFAILTWVERRVLSRFQQRLGPNRVGPFGLLQPIADLVKLLRKESLLPDGISPCST